MASVSCRLLLISASSAVGCPANCDLVFDLEGEGGGRLPDPGQIHPWAGKSISPLRDRMMVEGLFSVPETEKVLKSMVATIRSTIKKKRGARKVEEGRRERGREAGSSSSEEDPVLITVGVTCETGAQLSVCFVEQLYSLFRWEAPVDGVSVTRQHWDAFRDPWGRGTRYVWQQRTVPIPLRSHKQKSDLSKVGYEDKFLWVSFSSAVAREIEVAFQDNPYSNNAETAEGVVDFELGTLFRKDCGKKFAIRCTVASDKSRVRSWLLGHQSYLTAAKHYKAAGILPYSVHPSTGEAVFLLGKITYGPWVWCDFGGLKSHRERPRYTAARECREETLGVLGSTSHLKSALENYGANNAFKVVNENTNYVSHLLRIPFMDYPTKFDAALQKEGHVEVSRIRWFPAQSMRKAVRLALADELHIRVESLSPDGGVDPRQSHRLRMEFIQTLCIADHLGFLTAIENIAKTLHKQEEQSSLSSQGHVSYPEPRESSDKGARERRRSEEHSQRSECSDKATPTGLTLEEVSELGIRDNHPDLDHSPPHDSHLTHNPTPSDHAPYPSDHAPYPSDHAPSPGGNTSLDEYSHSHSPSPPPYDPKCLETGMASGVREIEKELSSSESESLGPNQASCRSDLTEPHCPSPHGSDLTEPHCPSPHGSDRTRTRAKGKSKGTNAKDKRSKSNLPPMLYGMGAGEFLGDIRSVI